MIEALVGGVSLLTALCCGGYVGWRIATTIRRRRNAREVKAEMQLDHAHADRIVALRKLQRIEAERERNPFLRHVAHGDVPKSGSRP